MTAPEPQDVLAWPAVDVGEFPVRECFAEMVGMPEYCLLDGSTCGSKPCRDWETGDS